MKDIFINFYKKESKITGLKEKEKIFFFLLCFITALIPFLYPLISGKGLYLIEDDFVNQQVPFITYLSGIIKHGYDTWAWDVDLGSSSIHAYGYYEIGSPFFLPMALLPAKFAPYLIGWVMLLKYIVACYTAQMFLKRFTKKASNAIPGALLYAFSGYQASNIVFNTFHDSVALFPLMLVGLEMIMEDKENIKHGLLFSLFVAINCTTNYFFFVQNTIFIVLYYLIRFEIYKNPKRILSDLKVLAYALLGVGLASFIFLPSIMYVIKSPRTSLDTISNNYFYNLKHIMYNLKGLLLPGDNMWDETALYQKVWTSTAAYLPFVGYTFVISYLLKKRDWLFFLLTILIIFSFNPITNSMFLAFTIDYQRWWYGLVLITSLASVLVLEDIKNYPIKKGIIIQAILILLLTIYIFINKESLYHPARFVFFVLLTIPGMIYAYFLSNDRPLIINKNNLIICISLFSILTTTFMEYKYKTTWILTEDYYKNLMKIGESLPEIEPEYRYRNTSNINLLLSTNKNTSGLQHYTSTRSLALKKFDDLFETYHNLQTVDKKYIAGLPEALGGKYLMNSTIDFTGHPENINYFEWYHQNVLDKGKIINVYPCGDYECYIREYSANKIAYKVNRYFNSEEWYKIPIKKRGIALLYGTYLDDDELAKKYNLTLVKAQEVEDMIWKYPDFAEYDNILATPLIDELCIENNKNAVSSFNRDEHGFSCSTNYQEDSIIFFSIPADDGWNIYIDNEKTDFIKESGLILLPVSKGNHEIVGKYHTPYFKEGSIVSLGSIIICMVLLYINKKDKQ